MKNRDQGAEAFRVWAILQDWKSLPVETQKALLAGMKPEVMEEAEKKAVRIVADGIGEPAEQDRTIEAQIAAWGRVLHAGVHVGQLSAGRYDAYLRNVGVFGEWAGPSSSIDGINANKLEAFHGELAGRVHALTYSVNYANSIMVATKQWINWLAAEKGLIPLPGNIRSKRIGFKLRAKAIEIFTAEEIKTILGDKCPSERTRLFILLALNCGMYQNDIAELEQHEVNLTAGTLTRKRSKTGDRKDAVEVTYRLWPETVALLKKYKSKLQVRNPDQDASRGGFLWFSTDEGNILVRYWLEGGKQRRYDCVHTAWQQLQGKTGFKKAFKVLRKTAATMLGEHKDYKYYVDYFLAHSPKSVKDRSYQRPADAEFFEACTWLRENLLGS